MNITRLSIERPRLILVVFIILLSLGLMSYFLLSYELVPKFNPPTVAVTSVYQGASPNVYDKRRRFHAGEGFAIKQFRSSRCGG